MTPSPVSIEKQDDIWIVTLDRPDVRNAVDSPTARALHAAITLARQLAAFPQATMRADRESALVQWDLPLGEALLQEWQRGKARIPDALEGATRFAAGQGRHGKF
ncbi:hypothetical protein [Hydrogenophaga sp.]|uniref:hypothetical protein n=1 Tax=Hydrogenophaga sp. TaxID=1904254 RepID=UPI003AF5AAB9